MFGIVARVIRYGAFFARLSAAHVEVEEFDPSTNCARVTVVETGFPGNAICIENTWVQTQVETSDAVLAEPRPTAQHPEPPTSELPDVSKKGGL